MRHIAVCSSTLSIVFMRDVQIILEWKPLQGSCILRDTISNRSLDRDYHWKKNMQNTLDSWEASVTRNKGD